jgi:hypothetical protein
VSVKKFKTSSDLTNFALHRGSSVEQDGKVFNSSLAQRRVGPVQVPLGDSKTREAEQVSVQAIADLTQEIQRQAQVIELMAQENKAIKQFFELKMAQLQSSVSTKPVEQKPSELIFTASYDSSGRITQIKTRKQ